ncbi:hypothetical protein EIP86_003178 [Pleurotus ostreatoroseus]|nr:hypothetical protein EIP86_003178 [Pleurotus ostreatoroseus]
MSEDVAEMSPVSYLPMHYRRIRLSSNGVSALAAEVTQSARVSGYESGNDYQDAPPQPLDEEVSTTESWTTLWDDRNTLGLPYHFARGFSNESASKLLAFPCGGEN